MITCRNIRKHYPPDIEVLRDVNLTLRPGGFYFLTGPSGVGKTTLLNILSLHLPPSDGQLIMFGQDVVHVDREVFPLLRRRIGCVYQNYCLLDHLTVAENIGLPQKILGIQPSEYKDKVEELLHWVHMEQHYDSYPHTLSGGEKQRVAIARAVINNPAIIIADEPTGNLDPELSQKVMYLLEALNKQGATVLIATHDPQLMQDKRYPVLKLNDGVIQEEGEKKPTSKPKIHTIK